MGGHKKPVENPGEGTRELFESEKAEVGIVDQPFHEIADPEFERYNPSARIIDGPRDEVSDYKQPYDSCQSHHPEDNPPPSAKMQDDQIR
jgi:hypothetical protein